MGGGDKGVCGFEHGTDHAADCPAFFGKIGMALAVKVPTVPGKIQPRLGFVIFSVHIGQLANMPVFVAGRLKNIFHEP